MFIGGLDALCDANSTSFRFVDAKTECQGLLGVRRDTLE
jgi:hypothetical protein